jgi:hypothetical protein
MMKHHRSHSSLDPTGSHRALLSNLLVFGTYRGHSSTSNGTRIKYSYNTWVGHLKNLTVSLFRGSHSTTLKVDSIDQLVFCGR